MQAAFQASQTMNNPADIINFVIEQLVHQRFELPAFSTLDNLVKHVRHLVNNKIFNQIFEQLDSERIQSFESLLQTPEDYNRSAFNQLKNLPKSSTVKNFREFLYHHKWLMQLGDFTSLLKNIPQIKIEQFAEEARSLHTNDLSEMKVSKRYALMICLIYTAQRQAKDALALIFCKTLARIHKQGNEKLEQLRNQHIDKTYEILSVFLDIVTDLKDQKITRKVIKRIRKKIDDKGGVEHLSKNCIEAMAYNSRDHYSLLPPFFYSKRSLLFKILEDLQMNSATQDNSLLQAIKILLKHKYKRVEYIPFEGDLSFAPRIWQKLIQKKVKGQLFIVRKHFEICVFSCIANELRSGDIFIEGAGSYADYRKVLLEWNTCEDLLGEYCKVVDLPSNAKDFVKGLKESLTKLARKIDKAYPDLSELIIDEQGYPLLKKRPRKKHSAKALWLAREVKKNMPERDLLDILGRTHHYTNWGYQYAPLSGSDPKMNNAIERYILNTFSQGTGLGPTQTAQHTRSEISAHMLSHINCKHTTPRTLDNILTLLINCCNTFDLPKTWGDGQSCSADGTFQAIYKENLIAEKHIRYGGIGGIGYHHVANNYVALFSTFIPCGVWEAIAILDGLLKNKSDIQPHILHADTQGQSTTVFGLAYLLGIKLMPRIRNWKDLTFYRPSKNTKYKHIDSLFGEEINWKLIETHWQDFMQVILSIKEGKISSSLILKKLNSYSRKNRLYLAFQELGRVIRTLFLLEYISNIELREEITANTNRVESYNGLIEWLSFGGMVIVASNDPNEMEKAIKYKTIIAEAVILQNIIDMTDIINKLIRSGVSISKEDLSALSPYLTEHIKRFGYYIINIENIPASISNTRNLNFI
jgi:TnpA family transposase